VSRAAGSAQSRRPPSALDPGIRMALASRERGGASAWVCIRWRKGRAKHIGSTTLSSALDSFHDDGMAGRR
jgi:hypothetical protein